MDALEPEARGFAENKGWKEPGDVVSGYRSLEHLTGVPQEQLIRMPTDSTDPEQMSEFHRRLGRPDTPDGYTLPKVELTEGQHDLQPAFRTFAHAAGISQKHAEATFKWYTEHTGGLEEQALQAKEVMEELVDRELKTEWGAEHDANRGHSIRAAKVLGLDDDFMDSLYDSAGKKTMIKGLARIGRAIAEHKFADDDLPATDAPYGVTPDAANRQIAELYGNKEFLLPFQDRQHPGHVAAVQRMEDLNKLAVAGKQT